MACADVAMAKAKAATATNLIIVFLHIIPWKRKTPAPRGWDVSAGLFRARAGREKTGADRPHLQLDGGYYRKRCGLQLKRNGKPYKELVKIAHPPIIRRRTPL
jgi:hypothetical protein